MNQKLNELLPPILVALTIPRILVPSKSWILLNFLCTFNILAMKELS